MSADEHLQRLLEQARDKGDISAIKFYQNALASRDDDEAHGEQQE